MFGIWLLISAFLWPHSASAETNTWIVGASIAIVAAWALFTPRVRWVNTLLASWLGLSTLFIYHLTIGTLWNNLAVAIIVFVSSMIPTGSPISDAPRREAHA